MPPAMPGSAAAQRSDCATGRSPAADDDDSGSESNPSEAADLSAKSAGEIDKVSTGLPAYHWAAGHAGNLSPQNADIDSQEDSPHGHSVAASRDQFVSESNASESTVFSATSASEIGKALRRARQEARRLHLRIKVPALLAGSVLMGVSVWWVYTSFGLPASECTLIRDVLRSLGCIAWLCHCLPTDRWAPRVGCAFFFAIGAKCLWFRVDGVVQYVIDSGNGEACAPGEDATNCWLSAYTILARAAISVPMHLWQLPYLTWAVFLPPRVTMARQWVSLSALHFSKGAADFIVVLPAAVVRAAHTGTVPWDAIVFSSLHGIYAVSMGIALQSTRVRRWVHFQILASSGALTVSAVIAAFIGNKSPEKIMEMAEKSCRFVSCDRVYRNDMLRSSPDPKLQGLATRCRLQDIDAFLTHSWHDDAEAKWLALQSWRARFKQQNGREPRLWIDKYCIDQDNIEKSLMCLPVFLAGCHTLLIIAGSTYLSRLWCVEELFVYLQMGRPVASIDLYCLSAELGDQISSFNVQNAQCSKEVDRQTLMATIEAGCEGFEAFNEQVRKALELSIRGAARV